MADTSPTLSPCTDIKAGYSLGLIYGSAIGGALTAISYFLLLVLSGVSIGISVFVIVAVFFGAWLVFGVGLVTLATPIWYLLHRVGLNNQIAALAVGIVLPTLIITIFMMWDIAFPGRVAGASMQVNGQWMLVNGQITDVGWHDRSTKTTIYVAVLASIGAIVSQFIWYSTYRWSLGAKSLTSADRSAT